MSSSLEKLRALTSKLEEKLEQKKAEPKATEAKAQRSAVPEEPAAALVQEQRIEPVKKPAAKPVSKPGVNVSFETVRQENIERVRELFEKLKIFEKSPDFDHIFDYKAMNLSGIGLKEEDFGQVREGKYIQVIAITYEPDKTGKKKAKNISLGYFGKAETLDAALKNEIIEFVLRWRYEKAFQNVEHYKELIEKIDKPKETLF